MTTLSDSENAAAIRFEPRLFPPLPTRSFPVTLRVMMARASGTIPTYTPSLYLPGSYGRYRQYPRVVRTQIPGAGVKGGRLVWGEQVMNLWGAPRVRYSTSRLPLLGLGQMTWPGVFGMEPRLLAGAAFFAGALTMHVMHRSGLM